MSDLFHIKYGINMLLYIVNGLVLISINNLLIEYNILEHLLLSIYI